MRRGKVRIELRRFATLRPQDASYSGDPESIELPEDATIDDLIRHLGNDPGEIHLILIDGRVTHDRAHPLQDGARVALFPPVGGG